MAKKYYAVLRGRQPGVYSSRMSAEAQVRCYSNAYHRGFESREEAEEWLRRTSGQRYPFYELNKSTTRTHRIWPRFDEPAECDIFLLHCDGASRGNPGPSGCGGAIWRPQESLWNSFQPRIAEFQHYVPYATSNVAEYRALVRGLTLALGLGIRNIRVQADSKLVVFTSCGQWATHHPILAYYRDFAQALLHEFSWWELEAIPRQENSDADELANAAIDDKAAGEVQLYGDHLEDAEDDMYRVLNKFTQYNFQARVVIHYEGEDVSEGPSWSDDEQYD